VDDLLGQRLEVLHVAPSGAARPYPILFVHGAFAGAWCWAEYFLPYFGEHGYDSYAVSLRGHGGSDGADHLHLAGLDDYAKDVMHTMDEIGRAPILVGHSMGGAVVQRCLDVGGKVAAVALLASVPPSGMLAPSLSMMWREPQAFLELNVIQHVNPQFATMETVRRTLFSDETSDDIVRKVYYRAQTESHRAILEMTWPAPRFDRVFPAEPPLVLGAGEDVIFPRYCVEETARHFDTEAIFFPRMGHAMMLEARWRDVADHILEWLTVRGL
jgi:pimeloyl-ACP methyl ester carboxylesterase